MPSKEEVIEAIRPLTDPELPVISLIDLGVIGEISITPKRIEIDLLPTFLGCPALDVMESEIKAAVEALGTSVSVVVRRDIAWTSERITSKGSAALKEAGIAPPSGGNPPTTLLQLTTLTHPCPRCNSTNTKLENLFGPTACRSIRYCQDCKNSYESFKSL
jgi:ring-1,2-phenylacetyl-CoA epoxidase subunit PaaD